MKKGGFVEAVIKAINADTDNWECNYYMGNEIGDGNYEWHPNKRAVYMQTRGSAIGPEANELIRCTMQMEGLISRVQRVSLEPAEINRGV